MRVRLRLFSILRDCLPPDLSRGSAPIDLPEGASLGDLVVRLGIDRRLGCSPTDLIGRAGWQVLVNGVHEPEMGRTLQDGDEVQIFPPVAGGQEAGLVATPPAGGEARRWGQSYEE